VILVNRARLSTYSDGLEYSIHENPSSENSNRQVADSFLVLRSLNLLIELMLTQERMWAIYIKLLLLGFAESAENKALFSEVTGLFLECLKIYIFRFVLSI
jgi:hypothetical protein